MRNIQNSFACVVAILSLLTACAVRADAQFNPLAGQWGKVEPTDMRVMTWNVEDAICSTNIKDEAINNWTACAVIIASMQPDILVLQEAGDNVGNGTGFAVDTAPALAAAIDMLFNGGTDIFRGGAPVGAFVQKYAPGYTLGHVFVSAETDGFNRNVIISRWPFTDINGDGRATISDIPFLPQVSYAAGGDGGVRGFQFAEIDLPDSQYPGDFVMGNAHLKAFGDASSMAQRITAARNVAFYIDHIFNGAGSGAPDPLNVIPDNPPVTMILDMNTPVVIAGDWNEDEQTNGRKGPAEWLVQAQTAGGTDGTDRDRSDATFDDARNPFTNSRNTRGGSKLDYIAWQDSVATLRNAWIFNTASVNSQTAPAAMLAFPGFSGGLSGAASDHLPVIADFVVPVGAKCVGDINGSGAIDGGDLLVLLNDFGNGPNGNGSPIGNPAVDLNGDGVVNGTDLLILLNGFGPCP